MDKILGAIGIIYHNTTTVVGQLALLVSAVATYLVGDNSMVIHTLLVVLALELLTGIIKGYLTVGYDSRLLARDVIMKLCYILGVVLANMCDKILDYDAVNIPYITTDLTLTTFVIVYLTIMEATSVTENLAKIGVPMPKRLVLLLSQVRDYMDLDDEEVKEVKEEVVEEVIEEVVEEVDEEVKEEVVEDIKVKEEGKDGNE